MFVTDVKCIYSNQVDDMRLNKMEQMPDKQNTVVTLSPDKLVRVTEAGVVPENKQSHAT